MQVYGGPQNASASRRWPPRWRRMKSLKLPAKARLSTVQGTICLSAAADQQQLAQML